MRFFFFFLISSLTISNVNSKSNKIGILNKNNEVFIFWTIVVSTWTRNRSEPFIILFIYKHIHFSFVFQTVLNTQRHRRRGRSDVWAARVRRRHVRRRTVAAETNAREQQPDRTTAARRGGGGGGDDDDYDGDGDGTAAEETDEERASERASERETRKWVIQELSRGEGRCDRRRPGELTAIRAERMTARAREDQ